MLASFTPFLLIVLAILVNADKYHQHNNQRPAGKSEAENAAFWMQMGQDILMDQLDNKMIDAKAKNIIFFLGDGMSIPTITAARIYKGQKVGKPGEEEQLSFDKFPFAALSRTYCTDGQVADSACTATAYLCGVKTDTDTLGLDANVVYKNCSTQNNAAYRVDSVMAWAQNASKATGIVTTTRVTHATPAASYAHVAFRDWETDYDISKDGQDTDTCDDIAEQLVHNSPGMNFKVILGGGRANFLPNTTNDVEGGVGKRTDGVDLIQQWTNHHSNRSRYVVNREALLGLNLTETDSILGLFSPSHLEYFAESANASNPTLEEMTRTAISLLQKDANGFVLLVEGGRIDHAHHDGRAKMALEETLQFDLAIQAALAMTNQTDTLIIVTADHAHTMSINGYPRRGNPILGLVQFDVDGPQLGEDGLPFATLSYANGPGYNGTFVNGVRVNLSEIDTTADSYKQPAGVPLNSETHGGDDVAIFAIGPQAHLFQGVYEQHYIAHVMGYAACIGPGLKYCDNKESGAFGQSSDHFVLAVTVFAAWCLRRYAV